MPNLMKRLMNRCRRELHKVIPGYKRQQEILYKVIQDLELTDSSDDSYKKALNAVSVNVIKDTVGAWNLPLVIYLSALKYNGDLDFKILEDDCVIKAGRSTLGNVSELPVCIHFLDVKDGCLHIEGNISWPVSLKESMEFEIRNNDEIVKYDMKDCGMDLSFKDGENIYEIRTVFNVDIPLKESQNRVIFTNFLHDIKCQCEKLICMRFSPVASWIKNQYCVRDGWIIYIQGNVICCERANDDKINYHEKLFMNTVEKRFKDKAEWTKSIRNEYFLRIKHKEKPIWLFMDRIDRADDNAEAMFRYVREHEEIDSYFVIQKDTKDYDRLKELGHIIEYNSREHHMLVLLADYIISSQANDVVENPFWDDAEFVRDLYHQAKIVFLQHGVIKDDMSITLDRFNTNFTGFITSAEREKQSILDYNYYYEDENVWLTGLPRFDRLCNNPQKYILIMPSWRQGLMEQTWSDEKNSMVWSLKENFAQSEYVERYKSLLSNKKLHDACEKYGYKLVFMPHALMEPYIDYFIQDNNCLYWNRDKSYRDAFGEGNLLVTDYSSVIFDFIYLRKPVLYYQFDKEKFFAEHTYTQGYFDYERDGFGEVVYDEEDVVKMIINYLENECVLKDKYEKRINSFFKYDDKNSCKRVFERIVKLK